MRGKWGNYRLLFLPALVVALVILLVLLRGEENDDTGVTAEAESSAADAPQLAPTATRTPTAEPTARPTETAVAPAATAVSVPTAADLAPYESVTEFFTVLVPNGWHTEEAVPGADLVMANSEAALGRYNGGDAFEAGDFVVNVGFLPYRLLQTNELRALDFQFDAPPDIFLQSLLPMFRMDDSHEYSDPERVSLSDDREAALLAVSAAGREGMIMMFVAGDSVIALVSAVAFPGEIGQLQELANAIAAGVSFNGAQDALYGTLLGG